MRMRRKTFNKNHYKESHDGAVKAIVPWLLKQNPNYIIDCKENYLADIKIKDPDKKEQFFLELEHYKKWKSDMDAYDYFPCKVCKQDEFSVPTGKSSLEKWLKVSEERRPNFTYVTFRLDFKMVLMTPVIKVIESPRKVIPNRFDKGRPEEFYIVNKSNSKVFSMEIN